MDDNEAQDIFHSDDDADGVVPDLAAASGEDDVEGDVEEGTPSGPRQRRRRLTLAVPLVICLIILSGLRYRRKTTF